MGGVAVLERISVPNFDLATVIVPESEPFPYVYQCNWDQALGDAPLPSWAHLDDLCAQLGSSWVMAFVIVARSDGIPRTAQAFGCVPRCVVEVIGDDERVFRVGRPNGTGRWVEVPGSDGCVENGLASEVMTSAEAAIIVRSWVAQSIVPAPFVVTREVDF